MEINGLDVDRAAAVIRSFRGRPANRNEILRQLGDIGREDMKQASNGKRLRAAVREMRLSRAGLLSNEFVLSSTEGYWITSDLAEVRDFLGRQRERAAEHFETAAAIDRQLREILGDGQGELFPAPKTELVRR